MTALPARSALLVGTGTGGDTEGDVDAMAQVLTGRLGFPAASVRTLRGPEATRGAVLDGLDALAAGCAPGGGAVFYFSGHGALTPGGGDAWGDDAAIEPYGAASRADLIADDVLFAWVDRLRERTSDVHVVIDACFSGGVDSDDIAGRVAGPRWWGGAGWPVDTRYALLASSRHALEAATATFPEWGGRRLSLLTGCLVTLLRDWEGPLPTYAELRALLDARTAARGTPQQPQVAGDVHREFLGTASRPSRRLVRLRGPGDLRAGAAHGVVAGSRWAVQPAGEVVVDAAGALRGAGRPEGGAPVPAGDAVAVEVARPRVEQRLRVTLRPAGWLGPPAPADVVAALAARLAASPLLDPQIAPEAYADDGSPAVVLACSAGHVTVVGDGVLLTRLHPTADPDTPERLVRDLEEVARWAWARAASGAGAPDDVAAGGVRLDLLRRTGPGTAEEVGADGAPPLLACGDVLAVRVRNETTTRVWPTLLHLGMDASVVRLFPTTPQSAPVGPGAARSWGLLRGSGWTVDRVAPGNDLRRPAPRRQEFALWVTSAETDLSVLEGAPVPAAAAGVIPRLAGPAVIETLRVAPPAVGGAPPAGGGWWATVRRPYLVAAPDVGGAEGAE